MVARVNLVDKLVLPPPSEMKEHHRRRGESTLCSVLSHSVHLPLEPPRDLFRGLLAEKLLENLLLDDTVHEVLRLRIEQEKTRQAQLRLDTALCVLELMRETDHHGLGDELLRRLFLDDDEDLRLHLLLLRNGVSNGSTVYNVPASGLTSGSVTAKNLRKNSENSSRKHLHTPSPNSAAATAPRSKSPAASELPGPVGSPRPHVSPRTSPSVVLSHQMYPVYYHLESKHPGRKNSEDVGTQMSPRLDSLGLPYQNQKYPGVVIPYLNGQPAPQVPGPNPGANMASPQVVLQQNLPQNHVATHQKHQQPQNHHNLHNQHNQHNPHNPLNPQNPNVSHPVPQHYYYINSLPPGMAPMVLSQYFVPSPMAAGGVIPWTMTPVVEKREEEPPRKKTKSGINFMITTPKNPPARKYNKS